MGRVIVGPGGWLRPNSSTENEFDHSVSETEVLNTLNQLSVSCWKKLGMVCYVFGMGAQPRSAYTRLSNLHGINLVYYRSVLPPTVRWLQFIIASYEGLIKVEDPTLLPEIFFQLMSKSMVGLYLFDAGLERDFVSEVCKVHENRNYDFGIKQDPRYLIYIVDADSDESPTGLVEIVSYGAEFPGKIAFLDHTPNVAE